MVLRHILNAPVEVIKKKGNNVIGATRNEYKEFDTNELYLFKQYTLKMPENSTTGEGTPIPDAITNSQLVNGSLVFDTRYEPDFELGYTPQGKINYFKRTSSGNRMEFDWYEPSGLLKSKKLHGCEGQPIPCVDQETTYDYDFGLRQPTRITDPNGRYHTYKYDGFGRLTQIEYNGTEILQRFAYNYANGGVATGATGWLASHQVLTSDNYNYVATLDREHLVNIGYIDGLGSPMQQVAVRQSGNTKYDLITPIEYDAFGREAKKYKPYSDEKANGSFRNSAIGEQGNFYQNPPQLSIAQTEFPYSETEFEPSPLNRMARQSAPGETWELNGGHVARRNYPHLLLSGVHHEAIEDIDENGNKTTTYKDGLGRTIREVKALTASSNVISNYFYDDFGNLRQVVTPAGTFQYLYDGRQRLIAKAIPGKEIEYFVYDNLDRLVLHQDGNMRLYRRWFYTQYDAFDRPIETGLVKIDHDRGQIQAAMNQITTYTKIKVYLTELNNYLTSLPTGIRPLTQTAYDPEGFKGQVARQEALIIDPDAPVTNEWLRTSFVYDDHYRVLQTDSDNHLGGTDELYNEYQQVTGLLISSTLHHNAPEYGGQAKMSKLRFYDEAERQLGIWNRNITSGLNHITFENEYDAIGQLAIKKLHSSEVPLDSETGFPGSFQYLQWIDYRYNPRGWLTHINDVNDLSASSPRDKFAEVLQYEQPALQGTAQYNGNISSAQWKTEDNVLRGFGYRYDGLNRLTRGISWDNQHDETFTYNLSGDIVKATRKGAMAPMGTGYSYGLIDNLSYSYAMDVYGARRLTRVADAAGANPYYNDFKDGVTLFSGEYLYDFNGNMTEDKNKGLVVQYNILNLPAVASLPDGKVIKWVYAADGRKLQKRLCTWVPGDVIIGRPIEPEATDLLADKHSYLTARFDTLSTNGLQPTDYEGLKTRIRNIENLPLPTFLRPPKEEMPLHGHYECKRVHDYIGAIEYDEGMQEAYYTEEGRINLTPTHYDRHEYALKDHLGNARVFVCESSTQPGTPQVLQESHYYAYGLPISELSRTFASQGERGNKYQYNQKELNDDFGLWWSDYGARYLDLQLSRWGQVDPLAEKYYAWSGYNYVGGNPTRRIDPDGKRWIEGKDGKPVTYDKEKGWSENATDDVKKLGNAMLKTQKGTKALGKLMDSKTKIEVKVDEKRSGKKMNASAYTEPKKGMDGKALKDKDGNYTSVKMVFFTKDFNEEPSRYSDASLDEFLNASGVHETRHATDKEQIARDEECPNCMNSTEVPTLNDEYDARAEYRAKYGLENENWRVQYHSPNPKTGRPAIYGNKQQEGGDE